MPSIFLLHNTSSARSDIVSWYKHTPYRLLLIQSHSINPRPALSDPSWPNAVGIVLHITWQSHSDSIVPTVFCVTVLAPARGTSVYVFIQYRIKCWRGYVINILTAQSAGNLNDIWFDNIKSDSQSTPRSSQDANFISTACNGKRIRDSESIESNCFG